MIFRKGDKLMLSSELLHMLETAEKLAGFDFEITSGFREGDERAHGKRVAVDIACHGSRIRFLVLRSLFRVGFRRIGIYHRHVHADVSMTRDDEVCWLPEVRRKT